MKRVMIFLATVAIGFSVLMAMGAAWSSQGTLSAFKELRATSTTDDTGLAAGSAIWSSVSSSAVQIRGKDAREQKGIVVIRFKAKGDALSTMNWCLYAVKETGEPAQFVAYGTATRGATETGTADEYYANTITITKEEWLSSLTYVPGYQYNLGTGAITNGGIALLAFDSFEHTYLVLKMSKGTATHCGADFSVVPTFNN